MRIRCWSLVLLFIVTTFLAAEPRPVTTVILVRHGEKVSEEDDAALSAAGIERARELVRVLSAAGITSIYTTQWIRTRGTAQPLADAIGKQPTIVNTGKTYAKEMADRIHNEKPGSTILVVGHSNTNIHVMRELGIKDLPAVAESRYDDLFICTLAPDAEPKRVNLRYGAPWK